MTNSVAKVIMDMDILYLERKLDIEFQKAINEEKEKPVNIFLSHKKRKKRIRKKFAKRVRDLRIYRIRELKTPRQFLLSMKHMRIENPKQYIKDNIHKTHEFRLRVLKTCNVPFTKGLLTKVAFEDYVK